MKYSVIPFLIVFLVSCKENKDDSFIRLNHFDGINTGFITTLCPFIQDAESFGTEEWVSACITIEGFTYERGFLYDLRVEKKYHDAFLADGAQFYYNLKEIVSKEKADDEATFEYRLKLIQGDQIINYVTGDSESGYSILGKAEIECGNWCDELTSKLESEDQLTGTFKHSENGKIRLIGLRSE